MTAGSLPELIALLGTFVGSAFALVRLSLGQHRAMTDRFVGFLEETVRRQEPANERFQVSLERLADNVRENSAILAKMGERLG